MADEPGGVDGQLHHLGRRLLHRDRAALAVDFAGLGLVVVDLPVSLGHEVLAGVQRLSIEYADAPVVFGVAVLLSQ
ncbi:hypothetical protein D3C84_905560 [compost metagenome]